MLWKDSAPNGWKKKKKERICLSTPRAGLDRRICVEKVSMGAHTDTHTYTYLRGDTGVLGGLRVYGEKGSQAIFDRLL